MIKYGYTFEEGENTSETVKSDKEEKEAKDVDKDKDDSSTDESTVRPIGK